jgi:hypothetical protein
LREAFDAMSLEKRAEWCQWLLDHMAEPDLGKLLEEFERAWEVKETLLKPPSALDELERMAGAYAPLQRRLAASKKGLP